MNKNECKKYLKKAFYTMLHQGKNMTENNLEIEMNKIIADEAKVYISYGKLAMHILTNSATEISAKQLIAQIDIIPKLFTKQQVLDKAKKI